jgi:dipeptidase
LNLSSDYSSYKKGAKPYDLFIKADRKLGVQDVIALHRDHYEGTEFDMTKDISSGPYGAPDRWRPMRWQVEGETYVWERPIATQQAAFVFVSQSRAHIPDEIGGINWYGMDNPYTNVFVPFYTSITELPESYTTGSLKQYTRDSAWWTFNFVANFANLRYSDMIKDIQKVQKKLEDQEFKLQATIEKTASELLAANPELVHTFLTNYCVSNAEAVVKKWRQLGDFLITKYNDGYIQEKPGRAKEVGYPIKWLKKEIKANGKKRLLKEKRDGDREL